MTFRFLVSYHYYKDTDLQTLVDAYDGPVELFADSGAFSAATLGVTIRLADYAAWLKNWRHIITTAATLDVIGDPDATHRNTIALEDRGLDILPVFHTGSPWSRLEKLCASYSYVALGGMVPYARYPDEVLRWLVRCFRIGAAHGAVFHGFGQTRFATLAALPFYSVDSSSWGSGARYGAMYLWNERRARLLTMQTGTPSQARKYADLLRDHGADPAVVGRPGFAVRKQREREQYLREDAVMRGTPAVAFHRLGQWLASRHRVPPPVGKERPGTGLFLADTYPGGLVIAARAIAADLGRKTP